LDSEQSKNNNWDGALGEAGLLIIHIAFFVYFFWKLKTKTQTTIRLAIFLIFAIPLLLVAIVCFLDDSPEAYLSLLRGYAWCLAC